MENKDEFYIGYVEKGPASVMRFIKKRVFIIALLVIFISGIFAWSQKQFVNASFELGNLTEVKGVLHKKPYPMLRVQNNGNTYSNILLLGFGKFGAEKTLNKIERSTGDLEGAIIKLKGTLLYYDGKTLMQLEPKVEDTFEKLGASSFRPFTENLGGVDVTGEIIDPKCYFGVMKPGKGKIHRSCAIRCISGGIPPVFVSSNANNESEYFLLTDTEGNPVNKDVLDYIGKPVQLTGQLKQMDDWLILQINPSTDIKLLGNKSKIY